MEGALSCSSAAKFLLASNFSPGLPLLYVLTLFFLPPPPPPCCLHLLSLSLTMLFTQATGSSTSASAGETAVDKKVTREADSAAVASGVPYDFSIME